MTTPVRARLSALLVLFACTTGAMAADPPVPPPRDVAYPGTIALTVEATDLAHRVYVVRETIPVRPGPLTLLYPAWIPGSHAPVNGVKRVAGLRISAQGKPLEWRRDPVDLQAFHVDVPAGTTSLDVAFDHLVSRPPSGDTGVITETVTVVKWEGLVLYPAGHYASRIAIDPTVVLPNAWTNASALDARSSVARPDGRVETRYATVSLETLIDSPVIAGRYAKRIPLDPDGAARPVFLDLFADDPKALEASPEAIAAHRNVVVQLDRLFGARHFARYEILTSLTKENLGIGLEHHQSSENGLKSDYFTDWSHTIGARYLIPHEFTHSWNGKFRRPKDLWTPNFNVPMQNSLLWVYEGLTEYWGEVIAARSGMIPLDAMKERFATVALQVDAIAGRAWRPLRDTTVEEIVQGRDNPAEWPNWSRGEDYYDEGQLFWFDIDTIIRERSGGRRSLDDFARAFFGVEDGRVAPLLYDFDDIVAALERVQPYDWRGYLRARVDAVGPTPLDGYARAGWRPTWTDQQSELAKSAESFRGTDFYFSLGFKVNKSGELSNVRWGGPAFRAGLSNGMTLVAVNLHAYDADGLNAALRDAQGTTTPIELLLKDGNEYKIAKIDWHDGPRYPTLERIADKPDLLTPILSPK